MAFSICFGCGTCLAGASPEVRVCERCRAPRLAVLERDPDVAGTRSLLLVSGRGEILDATKDAADLMGLARSEVIGRPIEQTLGMATEGEYWPAWLIRRVADAGREAPWWLVPVVHDAAGSESLWMKAVPTIDGMSALLALLSVKKRAERRVLAAS